MKTLTGHDGLPLHWREWGADLSLPTRGTVLIVHGLGEHIGRYEAVAGRLNDWGWHAAGYDQRGHGASGGPRGDIPAHDSLLRDLAAAIDGLRADDRKGRGPLILLGHSMGGAVAARFVAGALEQAPWSRPVDGLILSSPALDPGLSAFQRGLLGATLPLVPHLAVGNGLNPSWVSRSPEVVQTVSGTKAKPTISPPMSRSTRNQSGQRPISHCIAERITGGYGLAAVARPRRGRPAVRRRCGGHRGMASFRSEPRRHRRSGSRPCDR